MDLAAAPVRPDDWPPPEVRQICRSYLDLVDARVPGLVEGLYLHGSVVFGEWHPGVSDVDFLAVTSRRPAPDELAALREVHAEHATLDPHRFDGCYVTWSGLAVPPDPEAGLPCILAGQWEDEGHYAVNPVTWHEVGRHGVTVRGPQAPEVWTDDVALRRFSHDNLSSYWGANVPELARFPREAAAPEAVAWFVLGTARLHHLLATGAMTSKDGAGRYAREAFGERWAWLADEALAARATGALTREHDPLVLGAEVAAFAAMVVATGLEIPV